MICLSAVRLWGKTIFFSIGRANPTTHNSIVDKKLKSYQRREVRYHIDDPTTQTERKLDREAPGRKREIWPVRAGADPTPTARSMRRRSSSGKRFIEIRGQGGRLGFPYSPFDPFIGRFRSLRKMGRRRKATCQFKIWRRSWVIAKTLADQVCSGHLLDSIVLVIFIN